MLIESVLQFEILVAVSSFVKKLWEIKSLRKVPSQELGGFQRVVVKALFCVAI